MIISEQHGVSGRSRYYTRYLSARVHSELRHRVELLIYLIMGNLHFQQVPWWTDSSLPLGPGWVWWAKWWNGWGYWIWTSYSQENINDWCEIQLLIMKNGLICYCRGCWPTSAGWTGVSCVYDLVFHQNQEPVTRTGFRRTLGDDCL